MERDGPRETRGLSCDHDDGATAAPARSEAAQIWTRDHPRPSFLETTRVDGVRLHIDAGTDGGEVLVLALLRETTPLDVGEVLFFPVGRAPRLHDGLGVGRGGVAGGAAHGGCL